MMGNGTGQWGVGMQGWEMELGKDSGKEHKLYPALEWNQ